VTVALLNQVRDAIRVRHYSLRTEQSYLQWIKRYILFHGTRHPRGMGEVTAVCAAHWMVSYSFRSKRVTGELLINLFVIFNEVE